MRRLQTNAWIPALLLGLTGLLPLPGSATTLPPAFLTTSCVTSSTGTSQTCVQTGPTTGINAVADLATLSASARIDVSGPYGGFPTFATVYYYAELVSSNGVLGNTPVPIVVTAQGSTSVGASGPNPGNLFSNNKAESSVRAFGYTFFACSGFQCVGPPSFGNDFLVDVRPNSSTDPAGLNVWRIEVNATATVNSNYPSSFAHAFADPQIRIEPSFLAANPQFSLIFSDNLPQVPEPSSFALLGTGLLGLLGWRRSRATTRYASAV